jgi:hypothetical protein
MQYINEAKRFQKLAGITELFGLGNDKKYHLVVTVPQDVPRADIKAGKYKIDLPKRMWPGTFNDDSKELYSYLGKYPSSTKVELVNNDGEVEETGMMIWHQNTPEGEINLDENQVNENEVFDLEAIKKQIEDKVEQDPNLKEVLGTLAGIGLALAVPAMLQGIATLIEKGNRELTSKFTPEQIAQIKASNKEVVKTGQGHKQYTSAISKEIDEYAHWLHDMCLKPIEGVLYIMSKIPIINRLPWIKDPNKRHKLAEAIYLVIALGIGGMGIASHAASITGVIDAVKLGDVAIDSSILANKTGLLKNLPKLVTTLIA